jgi:hypothetical protein
MYDFYELHTITVQASPSKVFRAVKELTSAELSTLVHLLVGIRALPQRLAGQRGAGLNGAQPILAQLPGAGLLLLGEEPDRDLVLGIVGQFWRVADRSGPKVINSVPEFLAFAQPGYAKAAMNVRVDERNDRAQLITATRIYAPDRRTRTMFARYWRPVHPGSALIRLLWLRAIRRRAEHGSTQ